MSKVLLKTLPWKTAPSAGLEKVEVGGDYGSIEIVKYGQLTVNELSFIQQKESEFDVVDFNREAMTFATMISQKLGIKPDEAFALLYHGGDGLVQFAEEVYEFRKKTDRSEPLRQWIYASAIVIYRIDKSWTMEDVSDPEKIPPQLLSDLADFCSKEKNGWDIPTAENEPLTEETVKKS